MGMDVFINGELTIQASKVLEAGKLLLEAIYTRNSGCGDYGADVAEDDAHRYHEWVKTPKGIGALLEDKMESFDVSLEDDGSLTFGVEFSTRHEEYDQWVFEALAPVIDDGEFCMSGDDYHWKWVIENGELSESHGETVYDHDSKAAPLIEKVVALIYPEGLKGKPIASLDTPDYEWVVSMIENLLRETGYGPQAGMNELERLANL